MRALPAAYNVKKKPSLLPGVLNARCQSLLDTEQFSGKSLGWQLDTWVGNPALLLMSMSVELASSAL